MSDIAINVCGLQPPDPMVRVLDALAGMRPRDRLAVTIDREPFPLYRILRQHGYLYQLEPLPDFLFQLLIWRPAV